MDWNRSVDLYCERLGPGLFAEPWNAASNLAFVVAGLWLLSGRGPQPASLQTLAVLVVLIGLGSAAFHLWAQGWAELLDTGFIALFVHFHAACWLHHVLAWRWRRALLGVPGFVLFSQAVALAVPPSALNGSAAYLPAWLALLLMGSAPAVPRSAGLFRRAAVVFAASLALRSVDLAWCEHWGLGTHGFWHLLNAVTLTLAVLGLQAAAGSRAYGR